MEMLGYAKRLLPLIGIIIFVYLIIGIGIEDIVNSFIGINPAYLAAALVLLAPYLVLQTYKWMYIAGKQGLKLGYSYLFRLYLIGQFYGLLTPGRLGTFIRIWYLRDKTKKRFSECSSNVILDKIIDILVTGAMSVLGIILLIEHLSGPLLFAVALFFIVILSVFMFFMKRGWSRAFFRVFYRFLVPGRLKETARQTFDSFYDTLPGIKSLVVPFILSALSWVVLFSLGYVIILSLGISGVPYHIFIMVFPVAMIIGLIPVTISGWGTREVALIALLSVFGISPGDIIVLSVMNFVLTGIIPAAAGAVFAFGETCGARPEF